MILKVQNTLTLFLFILLFVGCTNPGNPKITLKTELGNIIVEVDTVHAPLTAKNFLRLAKSGALNGSSFYRTVRLNNQPLNDIKIEVLQGGIYIDSLIKKYPAISHETTVQTGIYHKNGTLSMARKQPGTASTEFFICIGNQPELDFGGKRNPDGQGFAAFGKLISGMEIVRAIQQLPDSMQYLTKPVVINEILIDK